MPVTTTSSTVNGGSIELELLDAGSSVSLSAKNGSVRGTLVGSYDDFAIEADVKKGDSNLPAVKEGGEKALAVDVNNGDIDLTFSESSEG